MENAGQATNTCHQKIEKRTCETPRFSPGLTRGTKLGCYVPDLGRGSSCRNRCRGEADTGTEQVWGLPGREPQTHRAASQSRAAKAGASHCETHSPGQVSWVLGECGSGECGLTQVRSRTLLLGSWDTLPPETFSTPFPPTVPILGGALP